MGERSACPVHCAQETRIVLMRKGRMVIPLDPVREKVSCPSDSIPYTSGDTGRLFNIAHLSGHELSSFATNVFRSVCLRAPQIAAMDHGDSRKDRIDFGSQSWMFTSVPDSFCSPKYALRVPTVQK